MNSFTATPWPKDRVMPARSWERPAGMRVISSDDHLIEEPGLWENRLKGADKDRAPRFWKDETGFHLEVDGQNYDVPGLPPTFPEVPATWPFLLISLPRLAVSLGNCPRSL